MKKEMMRKVVVVFAVLSAVGMGLVALPLEYADGTAALALPIVGGGDFRCGSGIFPGGNVPAQPGLKSKRHIKKPVEQISTG